MKLMILSIAGALVLTGSLATIAHSESGRNTMDCEKMMREHMGGKAASDMHQDCMKMMHGKNGHTQAGSHHGVGVVKGVDSSAGTVTLQHEPIQSIGWPAMTMPFGVKDPKGLEGLTPAQKVEFDFVQQGSRYLVTSIK